MSAEILTSDGWKIMGHGLPLGVDSHCMVLVDQSNVMAIGGMMELNLFSNKTFIFNFDTKLWRQGPELKSPRRQHVCGMGKKDKRTNEVKFSSLQCCVGASVKIGSK